MDSILASVRVMCNLAANDTSFDPQLIFHTNSELATLTQLGVGPSAGFSIEDASADWTDWIPADPKLEFIKSYVGLSVRMVFDPPTSAAVKDALDKKINELEWRIFIVADPIPSEGGNP